MKNIKPIFPLFALFSPWIIAIAPSNILAQQQQPNVHKEHLEYCVKQLPLEIAQLEAIKRVMQQENLMPIQKMEQVSQILSPQQKEQFHACMQQPMPSEGAPSQGVPQS